jgi:hypothetical protein
MWLGRVLAGVDGVNSPQRRARAKIDSVRGQPSVHSKECRSPSYIPSAHGTLRGARHRWILPDGGWGNKVSYNALWVQTVVGLGVECFMARLFFLTGGFPWFALSQSRRASL